MVERNTLATGVAATAANLRIDCEDWHGVHYSDFMNLLKFVGGHEVVAILLG